MFNKEGEVMGLSEDYPGMVLWYKILEGQKFTQEEWDNIVGKPNAFPKRFQKKER
tara:strand:- start:415 stop:579 length:165 start_codon:yes stop_codon:yes gene_type:complete